MQTLIGQRLCRACREDEATRHGAERRLGRSEGIVSFASRVRTYRSCEAPPCPTRQSLLRDCHGSQAHGVFPSVEDVLPSDVVVRGVTTGPPDGSEHTWMHTWCLRWNAGRLPRHVVRAPSGRQVRSRDIILMPLASPPPLLVSPISPPNSLLRQHRGDHVCTRVPGSSEVYCMGGFTNNEGDFAILDSVERFDAETETWEPRMSMVFPRADFALG